MRITHIITDLDIGGAEMMMYKLLLSFQDEEIESSVISLMGRGVITERIEKLGINIETLNLEKGRKPNWRAIKKLRRLILDFNPSAIQGWMYHGNIIATLAVLFCLLRGRRVSLFWNIRQTIYSLKNEKKQTQWVIYLSRWLSFFPRKIIYNSVVSVQQHGQIGFSNRKIKYLGGVV